MKLNFKGQEVKVVDIFTSAKEHAILAGQQLNED